MKNINAILDTLIETLEYFAENKRIDSTIKAEDSRENILKKFHGWGSIAKEFTELVGVDNQENARVYTQKLEKIANNINKILSLDLEDEKFKQYFPKISKLSKEEQVKLLDSSLRRTILTSYFTPKHIPISLFLQLSKHSIATQTQNFLDPSAGLGVYSDVFRTFFFKPEVTNIEIDPITALMATTFQSQPTIPNSFTNFSNVTKEKFDVIASNIPFNNIPVSDNLFKEELLEYCKNEKFSKEYTEELIKASFTNIHNYYFVKAAMRLEDNGVLSFITTSGSLDNKQNLIVMDFILKKLDMHLLDVSRFPDNLFKKAKTAPVTDNITISNIKGYKSNQVKQKEAFLLANYNPQYLKNEGYGNSIKEYFDYKKRSTLTLSYSDEIRDTINPYFHIYPDSVLGKLVEDTNQYGKPSLVTKANDNLEDNQTLFIKFEQALDKAFQYRANQINNQRKQEMLVAHEIKEEFKKEVQYLLEDPKNKIQQATQNQKKRKTIATNQQYSLFSQQSLFNDTPSTLFSPNTKQPNVLPSYEESNNNPYQRAANKILTQQRQEQESSLVQVQTEKNNPQDKKARTKKSQNFIAITDVFSKKDIEDVLKEINNTYSIILSKYPYTQNYDYQRTINATTLIHHDNKIFLYKNHNFHSKEINLRESLSYLPSINEIERDTIIAWSNLKFSYDLLFTNEAKFGKSTQRRAIFQESYDTFIDKLREEIFSLQEQYRKLSETTRAQLTLDELDFSQSPTLSLIKEYDNYSFKENLQEFLLNYSETKQAFIKPAIYNGPLKKEIELSEDLLVLDYFKNNTTTTFTEIAALFDLKPNNFIYRDGELKTGLLDQERSKRIIKAISQLIITEKGELTLPQNYFTSEINVYDIDKYDKKLIDYFYHIRENDPRKKEQIFNDFPNNVGKFFVQDKKRHFKEHTRPYLNFDIVHSKEAPIKFGERWFPTSIYADFIAEILRSGVNKPFITLSYEPKIDDFFMTKEGPSNWSKFRIEKKGRGTIDNDEFITQYALKQQTPEITYTIKGADGENITIVDTESMQKITNLREQIQVAFVDYIDNLPDEQKRILEEKYNYFLNSKPIINTKADLIDYSAINLHNMGIDSLYNTQSEAINKIVSEGGALIAHSVGTGKTLICSVAIHELKAKGRIQKPMILCKNANIEQFVQTYKKLYPSDKVLYPSRKSLSEKEFSNLAREIKNNHWDAIFIPHSAVTKFRASAETIYAIDNEQLEAYQAIFREKKTLDSESKNMLSELKELEKKIERIEAKIKNNRYIEEKTKKTAYSIRDLGIDYIAVDEAHEFKNLGFQTAHTRLSGIGSPEGSNRANNLYAMIRDLRDSRGTDKVVTFLTGTPLTNSVTELYLLYKFLDENNMKNAGIYTFDAWLSTYAVVINQYAPNHLDQMVAKDRLRDFQRIPELQETFKDISHIASNTSLKNLPKLKVQPFIVPSTKKELEIKDAIAKYTENGNLKKGIIGLNKEKADLKSSRVMQGLTAIRKLTLNADLIANDVNPNEKISKHQIIAENVANIYFNTRNIQATQAVFCDLEVYSPDKVKEGKWDFYTAMKNELVEVHGINPKEIRFVHEFTTDTAREKMMDDINSGKIPIIIGSRDKLGIGVNINKRLCAIHSVDFPYRPDKDEQAQGRILRVGNEIVRFLPEETLLEFRYIKQDVADAWNANLLDAKKNFISRFVFNALTERVISTSDVEEGNMSYAEFQEMATADPIQQEISKLTRELANAQSLHEINEKDFANMNYIIESSEESIKIRESNLSKIENDIILLATHPINKYFDLVLDPNIEKKDKSLEIQPTNKNINFSIKEKYDLFKKEDYTKLGQLVNDVCAKLTAENLYQVELFKLGNLTLTIDRKLSFLESLEEFRIYVQSDSGFSYQVPTTFGVLRSNNPETLANNLLSAFNISNMEYEKTIQIDRNYTSKKNLQDTKANIAEKEKMILVGNQKLQNIKDQIAKLVEKKNNTSEQLDFKQIKQDVPALAQKGNLLQLNPQQQDQVNQQLKKIEQTQTTTLNVEKKAAKTRISI